MPDQPVYIAESTPSATSAGIDVVDRPSATLVTTTTADPGAAGTTLAVTNGALVNRGGATGGFNIRVIGTSGIAEVMLVTAGGATNSWTVTRAQEGTTGVAHSIGATVAMLVSVQRVEPVDATRIVTFKGRAGSFRVPGRAGTTGQNLFAIHNATASTIVVDIEKIQVDLAQVAAAGVAPTVAPPVIRCARFTAVPTGGTAPVKVPEDTSLATNSAVTLWQDAQTDGVIATTALAVTINPANSFLTAEFAPRLLALGTTPATNFYEMFDRTTFFEDESVAITLRALEGVVLRLEYTLATQNPTTNVWAFGCRWTEYRNT